MKRLKNNNGEFSYVLKPIFEGEAFIYNIFSLLRDAIH